MDRISDKELWALIQVAGKHPNYLLTEKFWDTIVSAFTELRERRALDKSPYTWEGYDPQHPPDAATGRENH